MKEDDNIIKVMRDLLYAGKCFFRNLIQGNKLLLRKPGAQHNISSILLINNTFVCFDARRYACSF